MIKVVKTYIYTTKQTISRQKIKMMNAITNIKNVFLGDVAEAERQKAEQTKMMQAQIKDVAEENKKIGELACENAQQIIENKIEIGIVKSHVAKNDKKIEVLQRSYEQTDEFVGTHLFDVFLGTHPFDIFFLFKVCFRITYIHNPHSLGNT